MLEQQNIVDFIILNCIVFFYQFGSEDNNFEMF